MAPKPLPPEALEIEFLGLAAPGARRKAVPSSSASFSAAEPGAAAGATTTSGSSFRYLFAGGGVPLGPEGRAANYSLPSIKVPLPRARA